jgi:hypothetical protein
MLDKEYCENAAVICGLRYSFVYFTYHNGIISPKIIKIVLKSFNVNLASQEVLEKG